MIGEIYLKQSLHICFINSYNSVIMTAWRANMNLRLVTFQNQIVIHLGLCCMVQEKLKLQDYLQEMFDLNPNGTDVFKINIVN